MTEFASNYRTFNEKKQSKRSQILESREFIMTADIATALLIGGHSCDDAKELVGNAIAIREELIEQVGEKL